MVFGHAAIDKAQQAGAALLFALIGAAAQAAAPTAAYVVVVPVLIVVLAICLTGPGAGAMAKAAALVGAALVLGYMIYLGHFVMQGVGAPMAYVAALPITLAGMALLPVWPGAGKTASRRAGIAMAGLAFVVALWVRLDPVADTIAVYSSDKEVEAIPITKPMRSPLACRMPLRFVAQCRLTRKSGALWRSPRGRFASSSQRPSARSAAS